MSIKRKKGEGRIFKRGKFFYFQFDINKKRKVIALKTGNKADAEQKARELFPVIEARTKEQVAVHVAEARKLRKQSGMKLTDVWDEYLVSSSRPDSGVKTIRKYKCFFKRFQDYIESNYPEADKLVNIDSTMAEEYFSELWDTGITENTINSHLQAVKLVFKTLQRKAGLDSNPLEFIQKRRISPHSHKEFTQDQVRQIFSAFQDPLLKILHKEQMEVMFNICCWTGARGQDACLMRWDSVDFDKNLIFYIPEKTRRKTQGKTVAVPIHPQLLVALRKAQIWKKPKNPYIISLVAERYKRNPTGISKDSIKIFKYLNFDKINEKTNERRKLNANNYGLHSFRHTFVSFCANSGVPLAVVQSIVGHGSPAMTRHYAHISHEAAQKAVDSLPVMGNSNSTAWEKREHLKKLINTMSEDELEKALKLLEKKIKGVTKKIGSAVDEDLTSGAVESII